MVYCPSRKRLFTIPSPRSLKPLVTCRDDELLAASGLPLYSAGHTALLYDPDVAEGEEPRFYVAAGQAPAKLADKGVRGLAELREELAKALGGKVSRVGRPGIDPRDFPNPSARAEAWWVFTDRDTPYLVTRRATAGFDRFVDYLGGRSFDSSPKGTDEPPSGDGYLFAAEGSGLDAVEVLMLKLVLFSQVVAALRSYYQTLRLPHLDVHPGHLAVEALRLGDHLPRRWSFQTKLLGLSSAPSRDMAQGIRVSLPPDSPQIPYCSPAIRTACLLQQRGGELIIDRLMEVPSGGGTQWQIKARLKDPNGILPRPSVRDWLLIEWPEALLGADRVASMARCDPEAGSNPAELLVVTEPLELDAGVAKRLEQARNVSIPGIRYRVYPELHVPDDVYALGVLLLRLLLVNDRQDLSSVAAVLASVPSAIGSDANRVANEQLIEDSLAEALEQHPEMFATTNVLYRSSDRTPNRPNAISEELWQQILHFAWRLVARGPGFGLRADGGFDEDHPSSHLDEVAKEVDSFMRQLRLILFRRQTVHFEVHSVIDEMLTGIKTSADGTLSVRGK